MSFEMNRRNLVGGTAALMTAFGLNRFAFAQDASPEATAVANPVVTVTEGPGEDELTITHAQGETVIKKNPEKIVSFDVASIQSIEFLGGTLAGVPEITGEDVYASDAEIVGSLFEPDYEAINAMAPDLILIAGRSAAAYPDLSNIAPTVDITFADGMVESFSNISRFLGTIVGNEQGAEDAIAEVETRVAALQEATADAGTAMMLMASAGSITALAPGNARGGRGALIYNVLGMLPPVEDLETATHGEPISFEFLLEHNPDWLFVIDRDVAVGSEEGAQPAEELFDNDIVKETTAYQNDQIVYVNPFDWYIITGAGIPSFDRMLTEIETAFGI